ncbi:kinase-like domain-containing protein [Aspergillus aurantiobrunneus]
MAYTDPINQAHSRHPEPNFVLYEPPLGELVGPDSLQRPDPLPRPINHLTKDAKTAFWVEEQIRVALGDHPRIVHDWGNLQTYLDQHVGMTELSVCPEWCYQAAGAISYIHQKGVIHSDLCPDNLLRNENQDLLLCDFGGSTHVRFASSEDMLAYTDMVDGLFMLSKFPSTDELALDSVIQSCWRDRYHSMEELLRDVECSITDDL